MNECKIRIILYYNDIQYEYCHGNDFHISVDSCVNTAIKPEQHISQCTVMN